MNKVIIVGRLSNEPFNGKTSSGVAYSRFTVAVQRSYQSANTNTPIVDYVPCVAWRQNADFINKFLDKGSLILVEGQFQSSRVTSASGAPATIYNIQVERVESLETRAAAEQRRKNTGEFSIPSANKTDDSQGSINSFDDDVEDSVGVLPGEWED